MLCNLKYYVEIFPVLLCITTGVLYSPSLVLWQHREILPARLLSTCISIIAGCLSSSLPWWLVQVQKILCFGFTHHSPAKASAGHLPHTCQRWEGSFSFMPLTSCHLFLCVRLFPSRSLLWVHIAGTSELWYPKLYWIYQHLFQICTSWVVPETSRPWDANTCRST